jgi:D-tagatose-1,6-bisphosphate aldolase subunit GatZ/KbaZ
MNIKNPFSSSDPLCETIQTHKQGRPVGVYSICTANLNVLQAAMRSHRKNENLLLIESTCNQVNQEGGYSGMTPAQFAVYLQVIAGDMNFPAERIVLGGDHLGPNPWKNEKASIAMEKAEKLVADFVTAGYAKIHLDTSMPCDDETTLSAETIAERSAQLCLQAEKTAHECGLLRMPVYVIGTEVPTPGGMTVDQLDERSITKVEFAEQTLQIYRQVFSRYKLDEAFQRIIAMVISPGVEFNDKEIFPYDHAKTEPLSKFIDAVPGMVYEAHSTDYQTPQALKQMVEDHFAILKVGPALTFAFRETVFQLASIENEIIFPEDNRSHIMDVLLTTMQQQPSHWKSYYSGTDEEIQLGLKFGFSDRARYYWGYPAVHTAYLKMMFNLSKKYIPLSLISQYFPQLFPLVKNHYLDPLPISLIFASIEQVLLQYQKACGLIG